MARILLVIGHHAFRDSIAAILEQERNLQVIGQAESVAECRSFLSSGEQFDVAIVDLSLPDATEVLGVLREANPNASVMVLTIGVDSQDHARARAAGADEMLSKASSLEELTEAVRRLAGL